MPHTAYPVSCSAYMFIDSHAGMTAPSTWPADGAVADICERPCSGDDILPAR